MAEVIQRLNYFDRQFLREEDFNQEQGYHVQHQRDHARLLHTPGIAAGLDIPDPPAGATAVSITAGVAYDDQGRRILLADNIEALELEDFADDVAVYVTIAYRETQTDPTDETGVSGNTRWTESPLIETSQSAPANANEKLLLALIERSGKLISAVVRSERRVAGVKGGDLEVSSMTLTSEAIAPSGWVTAELGTSGRADLAGSLRVVGDLTVTGSIQGNIALNSIESGDLLDNAVISAKLAEADGTSAQNTNAGSGVKTAHLQDGAVTLQKLALEVRPIVSIEGVSNPGGNIDLVPSNTITVAANTSTKQITIGESHSQRTDNPHSTTAAQVNALALTGGVLSGNLQVNGNLGINAAAPHRLYVLAGDEADNNTYGVVSQVSTGAATTFSTAYQGSVSSSGNGTLHGLNVSASGNGTGYKYGVFADVNGEGEKYGGYFNVATTAAASSASAYGLNVSASTPGSGVAQGAYLGAYGDGAGQKSGVYGFATGANGAKYAAQFQASTSGTTSTSFTQAVSAFANSAGSGGVRGMQISASGNGSGEKDGIYCQVSGAEGNKYAAQFNAISSGAASSAFTQAIYAYASSAGTGQVQGLSAQVSGDGAGEKFGLVCYASGADGGKYAGQFTASTGASTSAAYTQAISASADSAGSGGVRGISVGAYGAGSGTKFAIYANASGADGVKRAAQLNASTSGSTSTAYTEAIYASADSAGSGAVHGLTLYAQGDGAGQKGGIDCNVSGANGDKYAAQFSATTTANTTAFTEAVHASASTAGSGTVRGLYTSAQSDGGGQKWGIVAYANGADGHKYAAQFNATTSSATSTATTIGLQTTAVSSGTGQVYGIYSSVGGSGTGTKYAGYFIGNVYVAGTLSKTSGTFLIDHPLDPYKRTLRHNFVESPEELCVYRGKAALDASGKATVKLPEYFAALTKEEEATVTLTAIGKKPFLASYEWNKKFTAFTVHGEPQCEVSYIVLATRDDPAIHVLRRPVEEDKTGAEADQLLFPQAYAGQTKEKRKGAAAATLAAAPGIPDVTEEMQRIESQAQTRDKARRAEQQRIDHEHREQEQQAAAAAENVRRGGQPSASEVAELSVEREQFEPERKRHEQRLEQQRRHEQHRQQKAAALKQAAAKQP